MVNVWEEMHLFFSNTSGKIVTQRFQAHPASHGNKEGDLSKRKNIWLNTIEMNGLNSYEGVEWKKRQREAGDGGEFKEQEKK